MIRGRREFLKVGGGVIATPGFPCVTLAGPVETIEMRGTARGEHVWFAPVGLAVAPGTTWPATELSSSRDRSPVGVDPHPRALPPLGRVSRLCSG
ncbi:hypothetical protein DEM26_16035 [Thioclava sp. NG1]|nr:hypothetical protein DEM26_16035 [Thioclava sp. NG1]